jgi:N-acetylmuramoyl-L-alanine amidase
MTKKLFLLLLALVWSVSATLNASAAQLLRVRHSSTQERTRVVLDLSQVSQYRIRSVHNPERIVLEFPHSAKLNMDAIKVDRRRVKRVRFNDLRNRLQVVLDLEGQLPYHHFSLEASEGKPPRVVIDVSNASEARAVLAASASAGSPPDSRSEKKAEVAHASSPTLHAPGEGHPYVIVIDPGHGGKDPGTRGCGVIREKDLVLNIAKYLAEELRLRTNFKVVLTRHNDRFVDLHGRVQIARRHQGDLFLSIHANSARSSRAHGAEIYFLSPRGATDQAAAELANRENAAHMVGMGSDDRVDDTMMSILMDLQSSGILRRSGQFAELTLEHLGGVPRMDTRFIKQARFAVLRTLSMPSILVEVGYLSNKTEARHLRRRATQEEIGRAIASAVIAYCERYGEKGEPQIVRQRTHKVQRGDTLWDIARVYDTSVVAIRELNHLKTSSLRVGQDLVLP